MLDVLGKLSTRFQECQRCVCGEWYWCRLGFCIKLTIIVSASDNLRISSCAPESYHSGIRESAYCPPVRRWDDTSFSPQRGSTLRVISCTVALPETDIFILCRTPPESTEALGNLQPRPADAHAQLQLVFRNLRACVRLGAFITRPLYRRTDNGRIPAAHPGNSAHDHPPAGTTTTAS